MEYGWKEKPDLLTEFFPFLLETEVERTGPFEGFTEDTIVSS